MNKLVIGNYFIEKRGKRLRVNHLGTKLFDLKVMLCNNKEANHKWRLSEITPLKQTVVCGWLQ